MELAHAIDYVTLGASIGLIAGLYIGSLVSKSTRRLEYERGRLDGINALWPYILRYLASGEHARYETPSGDYRADGDDAQEFLQHLHDRSGSEPSGNQL